MNLFFAFFPVKWHSSWSRGTTIVHDVPNVAWPMSVTCFPVLSTLTDEGKHPAHQYHHLLGIVYLHLKVSLFYNIPRAQPFTVQVLLCNTSHLAELNIGPVDQDSILKSWYKCCINANYFWATLHCGTRVKREDKSHSKCYDKIHKQSFLYHMK